MLYKVCEYCAGSHVYSRRHLHCGRVEDSWDTSIEGIETMEKTELTAVSLGTSAGDCVSPVAWQNRQESSMFSQMMYMGLAHLN